MQRRGNLANKRCLHLEGARNGGDLVRPDVAVPLPPRAAGIETDSPHPAANANLRGPSLSYGSRGSVCNHLQVVFIAQVGLGSFSPLAASARMLRASWQAHL